MAFGREERRQRATSFGGVAGAYERARPGYPDAAVRWLTGEEPTDVVDRGVAHHAHDAGLGIDLDLGDVAAVGEGHLRRDELRGAVERAPRLPREVEEPDRAVGAPHPEAAVGKLHVERRGLEPLGREPPALVDRRLARERHGAAGHHQRAGGDARGAGGDLVAVALDQADRGRVDAELLRDEARVRRQVALPHRLHARAHGHGAVGLEAKIHRLVEDAARHLEEAAEADPAEPPGALGGGAARREALPVGERKRLVEHRLELAAVVHLPVHRAIGHGAGTHEVAAA